MLCSFYYLSVFVFFNLITLSLKNYLVFCNTVSGIYCFKILFGAAAEKSTLVVFFCCCYLECYSEVWTFVFKIKYFSNYCWLWDLVLCIFKVFNKYLEFKHFEYHQCVHYCQQIWQMCNEEKQYSCENNLICVFSCLFFKITSHMTDPFLKHLHLLSLPLTMWSRLDFKFVRKPPSE
jgi:hypothetical protein